jgi:hypothetical protein
MHTVKHWAVHNPEILQNYMNYWQEKEGRVHAPKGMNTRDADTSFQQSYASMTPGDVSPINPPSGLKTPEGFQNVETNTMKWDEGRKTHLQDSFAHQHENVHKQIQESQNHYTQERRNLEDQHRSKHDKNLLGLAVKQEAQLIGGTVKDGISGVISGVRSMIKQTATDLRSIEGDAGTTNRKIQGHETASQPGASFFLTSPRSSYTGESAVKHESRQSSGKDNRPQKTREDNESDPQRSTQRLLDYALIRPLREVTAFYEGTLVGSFMNEASAKTANSVRLTLGAHLKSLSFFQESPNPFSVRQWVRKEKDQSWLFLSSTTSLKECLAPLFSLWMTSAYSTLQSLSESSSRRLWFVMDELPSLGMMPSLPGALAEVRKYGGCFILGLQSLPQVEALYGQALTQTLVGLCGNKMVFRDENPVSNERVSLFLGVQDIEETAEHISYGSHPVRDGVSLSKVMSVKRVVDPSDIAELPDLTCFVKFSGGNSAVSRLTLPYLSLPEIASPFQERELPAMNPRPSVPQTAENLPLHDLLETLLKSEGGKGSES